jgi:hypothetical protein
MGKNDQSALDVAAVTTPLQQIAKCLAYLVVNSESLKKKKDFQLVHFLEKLGFDNPSIAAVLDTNPDSVATLKVYGKKKNKKPKKNKTAKSADTVESVEEKS